MKLPRIFDCFRQGEIFTIDEARTQLQISGNTLRKRLSELAARGYIFPVRQGLYRVSIIGEPSENVKSDPFCIAAKLTPYSYIGFKSALQLHALETPPEKETVYVVSPSKFNSFYFEGRYYYWCQSPDAHGLETRLIREHRYETPVMVTRYEKTIVDCLKRPAHCPSLSEFRRLCAAIQQEPDLELLVRYGRDYNISALFNRLGFFLESMSDLWKVPETLLNSIELQSSKKPTDWGSAQPPTENSSSDGPVFDLGVQNKWKIQFKPLAQGCEKKSDLEA